MAGPCGRSDAHSHKSVSYRKGICIRKVIICFVSSATDGLNKKNKILTNLSVQKKHQFLFWIGQVFVAQAIRCV